jgi:single-stranded-DNA-specific exonuclease
MSPRPPLTGATRRATLEPPLRPVHCAPPMPRSIVRPGLAAADRDQVREQAARLGVGEPVVDLLVGRGVTDLHDQERFLRPRLADLRPPTAMAGFDAALELLRDAWRGRWRVGVYGDYDVDGVTTTAILTTFLETIGVEVVARAATREGGYGFGLADAEALREAGVRMVLTGDCGTSDHEALAWLKGHGIPTIVIDHHQVPEVMPPAAALLNPHQLGCGFPFKGLCSAGVAFYLCAALRSTIARESGGGGLPDPRGWLDLVALGTVCDMVPLVAENRILVRMGLQVVGQRHRPGLRALLEASGVGADEAIDESHLGFRLGPRINAPGRLGPAEPSLSLLRARTPAEARAMADRVEGFNSHRREHQEAIVREALAILAADPRSEHRHGLVVGHERWLHGIVGIAAASVVGRYRRPAVVLAFDPARGEARGSVRTHGEVDVHAALRACAPLLRRFGGHRAAAGLTMELVHVPAFVEAFDAAVAAQLDGRPGEGVLEHDGPLPFAAVDEARIACLEGLGPYGVGFAPPRYVCEEATVERVRVIKQRHLGLVLRQGTRTLEAIAFSQAEQHPDLATGARIGCFYIPTRSSYRGRVRVQLQIESLWSAF